MKFFCEYCGNRIDASKDSKCPNCGASYKKNKSFKKLEEEKKNQEQINNQNKQKLITGVFSIFKIYGILSILPFIIFIAIIVTVIIVASNNDKKHNVIKDNNQIQIDGVKEEVEDIFNNFNKEEKEESVTVNFNEFATTKNYKVKVEKYEVIEDTFHRAEEGYELVKFYLLVENITDKEISSEDINCVVDGIAQNNYYYSGHSDLPFHVSIGLTVKGTSTFIVPKAATSYDIKYGDYVTIHIQK